MNSKKTKRLGLFQFVLMAILFLLTLTMVVPLLHILARSLSDPLRSGGMNGLDILPKGLTFINYQVLFSNKNVLPSIFNSLFITLVGTVLNILLTILAAYALTRPQLVGKRVLMVFFIIMMLFDPGIVPEYMVVKALKLTGSQWSIILCQAMNVYYLIVMMRYFEAVPPSLYEAARISAFSSRSSAPWPRPVWRPLPCSTVWPGGMNTTGPVSTSPPSARSPSRSSCANLLWTET